MTRIWSIQGRVPYDQGHALQRGLVDLRALGEIPDTVLFLEHEPVITRGRGLQWTGAARDKHEPLKGPIPPGIAFHDIERGGDLTYHGPGQLVIYPIFKLDGSGSSTKHDIASYLRMIEGWLIELLSGFSLKATRRENATGVWIGEKKIASIGIAVSRWITYHGLALNVTNDLKPFYSISPCGFAPEVMTRLSDHLPTTEAHELWKQAQDRLAKIILNATREESRQTQIFETMTLKEALQSSSRKPPHEPMV